MVAIMGRIFAPNPGFPHPSIVPTVGFAIAISNYSPCPSFKAPPLQRKTKAFCFHSRNSGSEEILLCNYGVRPHSLIYLDYYAGVLSSKRWEKAPGGSGSRR